MLDLGYHGFFAELPTPCGVFEEIKIDLALPLVNYEASDLYGKVVKIAPGDERPLCGIEFTSASSVTEGKIREFVQLLLQGTETA